MANTKIIISKEKEQDQLGETTLSKKQKEKVATMSLLAHQAIANGQKILNYSISNIGNFTGDYTKTEGIQFALGITGDIATIGVGLATSPVGAVIAVAGVAISKGLEVASYFQEQKHREFDYEYSQTRSGNALWNDSRGTEN